MAPAKLGRASHPIVHLICRSPTPRAYQRRLVN
uniref:Uncharacterized protein n=1 Tax=Salmonella phage vB_STmST313_KE27 TaxID=3161178 RepID=A0AAU8GI12_9CAUD